jgi:hypothetical protein
VADVRDEVADVAATLDEADEADEADVRDEVDVADVAAALDNADDADEADVANEADEATLRDGVDAEAEVEIEVVEETTVLAVAEEALERVTCFDDVELEASELRLEVNSYTFKRFEPPQSSVAFPEHVIVQSDSSVKTAPAERLLPQ